MNNLYDTYNLIINNSLFLLIVLIIAFFIFWKVSHIYKKLKGRFINQKGKDGEKKAVNWLKKHNYKIINEQEIIHSKILVNGKLRNIKANPDIIALKDNQQWVIEVKTGGSANINKADIRRQIRENACLFPYSTIGFFDADKMELFEIEFPELNGNVEYLERRSLSFVLYFFMGLIVGCALIWFIK